MALIKDVPTEFGVSAAYWHIFAVEHNRPQRAAQVTFAGYIDEAARRAGRRPLATLTLTLTGDDFPGTSEGLDYATLYERVKCGSKVDGAPAAVLAGALDA